MKSHLLKITFCALVLASAGIARADKGAEAAAVKPAEAPAAAPAPAAPPEETKDWSVAVGMDLYSEYIFRGIDILDNREVWVPSVIAKYKGFTASYFGYFGDVSVPSAVGQWYEETDLSIDYTQTLFDKLALTGGALWYIYNDGGSGVDTVELYGKAAWSDGILNPYAALNWDIDEFHGGYLALGVSHTFDLSKCVNLKDGMSLAVVPMAQVGFDFGNIARNTQSNADWNDLLFGVSVPFGITPALNVHVGLQMSVALNSVNHFYNAGGLSKGNEVIGNVGVGYSF